MRHRVQLARVGEVLARRDFVLGWSGSTDDLRSRAQQAAQRYFGCTIDGEELSEVVRAYRDAQALLAQQR